MQELLDQLASANIIPRGCSLSALAGGVTNQTYRLRTGSFDAVLRVNRTVAGVDRGREARILRAIADQPWAPTVLQCDPAKGYLLTAFESGQPWSPERARSRDGQVLVGHFLSSLHAHPADTPAIDALAALDDYLHQVRGSSSLHARRAELLADLGPSSSQSETARLCHLELIASNLLGSGDTFRVIDWEFAGGCAPSLDLAFFMHYQGLDMKRAGPLLDAYGAGPSRRPPMARLELQLRLAALLDDAWRVATARPGG